MRQREWWVWQSLGGDACRICLAVGLIVSALVPHRATAQRVGLLAPRWAEATVGSEAERYLRVAALTGDSASEAFTLRSLSPRQLERVTPRGQHPWASHYALMPTTGVWLVRPAVQLIGNSAFPWGMNDGPLWAGRGITTSIAVGVAARWRWLSAQLAPQAWWTQNRAFRALPAPVEPSGAVLDYASPEYIDLPQRFGAAAMGRLDPGESWLRVDVAGLSAGVTTAQEWWGPGIASAAVLGNNAGGFPRIFAGTSSPVFMGLGRFQGRVMAGRLARSAFSTDTLQPTPYRLALGMTGSFSPAILPGVELGFTRFFHRQWPAEGVSVADISPLWQAFLKDKLPGKDDPSTKAGAPDNQLASFFGRVRLPSSGTELYWEAAREDHAWDSMDLLAEPDHIAVATFGAQHRWDGPAEAWWLVRAEFTKASVTHLSRVRGESLFYEHGQLRDGHTLRGQLLGSPIARGGSGGEVGVDRYTASGRLSLRYVRLGMATEQEGGLGYGAIHTLELSGVRFLTIGDLTWRVGADARLGAFSAWDASNWRGELGWRMGW